MGFFTVSVDTMRATVPRPPRSMRSTLSFLSRAAFWAATTFPVLYLPVFVAGERLATGNDLLVGLVGVHLMLLFVGHRHLPSESGGSATDSEETAL